MTTLRDTIAAEVADFCNSAAWERGEIHSTEVADAILAAIRKHFEGKPERVSDEMCATFYEVWHSPGNTTSPPARAALAAALSRIE